MLKQFQNDNNTIHHDPGSEQSPSNSLEWVSDPELSARHLAAQITDPKICGAILFSQSQQSISYAGDIIESTARQIADTVSCHWDAEHRSEIARFITLEPSQVDYLLFALSFTQDVVLAVLFDPSYPLSQVRSHSKQLLQDLITTPLAAPSTTGATGSPHPDEDFWSEDFLDEDLDEENEGEDEDFPDIDITDLLIHMPSPDPEMETPTRQELQEVDSFPVEEAILNDLSAIPAFFIPPSEQSKTPKTDLDTEEDFQALFKEDALPSDSIAEEGISGLLSDDSPEEVSPFVNIDVEEETKTAPEANADSIEENHPEQEEETGLPETDLEEESFSAEFSLENDLILPWEMEDEEPFPLNAQNESQEDSDELVAPEAKTEPPIAENEPLGSPAPGNNFLDFLDDDLEGILLPEDGTGWLAPFSQEDRSSSPGSNEPDPPVFSFEEELVPPIEASNGEAFLSEEIPPDILDHTSKDEGLNFGDEGILAALEAGGFLPQEEPETILPLDALEVSGAAAEITPEEELEEPLGTLRFEADSAGTDLPIAPSTLRKFPNAAPEQSLSETRPNWIHPSAPVETGENGTEGKKSAYTCVLVPNLPENILAGPLAKKLGEWLPQLSESFGWHLDKITIRPSHLQWTVEVPQTVSTARLVHSIRIHTSQRIYDYFPELKHRSPEDFWGPSQLIISGEHSPTPEMIESFIQKSRQHN